MHYGRILFVAYAACCYLGGEDTIGGERNIVNVM